LEKESVVQLQESPETKGGEGKKKKQRGENEKKGNKMAGTFSHRERWAITWKGYA